MKTKSMQIKNNKLYMGNFSLEEIAERYGTPLYVYDEQGILDKINRYKKSFSSNKENIECKVVYASKAFICPRLCELLKDNGLFIDAITAGDLYLLQKADFPMENVVLHGNNKSQEELLMAIDLNVGYIVVDNLHELKLLKKLSE